MLTISEIRKKNGQILMVALVSMSGPTDLNSIVKYIAKTQGTDPSVIKPPIKAILRKGLNSGFLQRNGGGHYCISGDIEIFSTVGKKSTRTLLKKKRQLAGMSQKT